MGFFSTKPKKVIKTKRMSRRRPRDDDYDEYDDDEYLPSSADYSSSSSDYLSEFKEGIDEISSMFREDTGKSSEKFAQLAIAFANFNQYRNSTFDDMVGGGMSERSADKKLRSTIVKAGVCDMISDIMNYRVEKKRRRRS